MLEGITGYKSIEILIDNNVTRYSTSFIFDCLFFLMTKELDYQHRH